MKPPSKFMQSLLFWVVVLLIPLVLSLGAVRAVLHPWFVEFEYRTPGFPADPFGFTREERLKYSRIALEYLLNDADISFLGDLRFPQGQRTPDLSCQFMDDCTRLYNDRELQHMLDVKNVLTVVLRVWVFTLGVLLFLGVWAWRGGWGEAYRRAFSQGSFLTVGLIGIILLLVLVAFGVFFIFFHQMFFSAGTWMFYYSDTLIRLFPERFWRDTFLVVGLLAVGAGLLLGFGLRKKT